MAIKISISSVEALNRLISGDEVLEMEIKEQVVVEFSKRHLKSLVPGIIEKFEGTLKAEVGSLVKAHYFEEKQERVGWRSLNLVPKELTEKLKLDAVKQNFEQMIREVISEKADEVLKNVFTEEYVKARMNMHIEDLITQRARELVAAKLRGL